MPSLSKKLKTIREMEEIIILNLMHMELSGDDQQKKDDLLEIFTSFMVIQDSIRYSVPFIHNSIPKSKEFINKVVPLLDNDRFKILFRISKKTFHTILNLIKDDEVFQYRGRGPYQYPVELQLQVVLFRLGSSGEAGSVTKTACLFGIGDGGSIQNFTHRVFSAILKLRSRFVYWPNAAERKEITQKTHHEMPFCIGYIDGTEIKLAEKPFEDPDAYLSRKKQWSVKAQIICDHKLQIRNLVVGYPGSVHDARIFKNCPIYSSPENYFDSQEYLLADSAYQLTKTVMTPFRSNARGSGSTAARNNYNRMLGKYRVRVENCIGLLKERFNSLKELKLNIIDDASLKLVNEWVFVCVIIHNIVNNQNNIEDRIEFEQIETFSEEIEEDLSILTESGTDGEAKREALVNILFS
uniref:CSON003378 protein n=1 Tax=Culicoides sonorensis TaxID=179676 RepID=A0A336MPN4_CULSO